jgi:hypothetical protein
VCLTSTMTNWICHRLADRTLCLGEMQLELGKQLTPVFEIPPELPPELSFLVLRMKQADQVVGLPIFH